jgi:hypothetical protein
MDTSGKLLKAWPIIRWLDNARWGVGASSSVIPGPAFASLDSCGQILTHWLCYITDQQRPWEEVWWMGGPIFAEVVQQYKAVNMRKKVLDLLRSFTIAHGTKKLTSSGLVVRKSSGGRLRTRLDSEHICYPLLEPWAS